MKDKQRGASAAKDMAAPAEKNGLMFFGCGVTR
jgi:hypothetical protein